jgi:hypothetical protein
LPFFFLPLSGVFVLFAEKRDEMKLSDQYSLIEFRGNHLLVRNGKGQGSVSLDKGLQVNGSFAFLWRRFKGVDFSGKDIVDALVSEYEISEEEASSAATDIIGLWRSYGMIVE